EIKLPIMMEGVGGGHFCHLPTQHAAHGQNEPVIRREERTGQQPLNRRSERRRSRIQRSNQTNCHSTICGNLGSQFIQRTLSEYCCAEVHRLHENCVQTSTRRQVLRVERCQTPK